MLSYQHAYHAGNAADLHKHVALGVVLEVLLRKPRPLSYLESHSGRGLYDMAGPEALKTGEAASGIAQVAPSGAFGQALGKVRAWAGAAAYPGSPLIAQALLRPQDRMVLCELHPAEHTALKAALGHSLGGPEVSVHKRDGHQGLRALCPPDPRRGLVLIDPSYEVKAEYAATAATALEVLRRWPQGIVMVWYPVLPAGRHEALAAQIMEAVPNNCLHSEVLFVDPPERGMIGSGLLILAPPYGAKEALDEAWAGCAGIFRPV
jgi:23S rRNA (adenine2030-N6)-methyltransferase